MRHRAIPLGLLTIALLCGACKKANRRAPFLASYVVLVFAFVSLPIVVLILYSFHRAGE